jgi:hypothetical protein
MSTINELGDLGDRMSQGLPFGQGGALPGASGPGVTSGFNSAISSPNLTKFVDGSDGEKKISPYSDQTPWEYLRDVEQIKGKVTPDEVIMGVDYEMKKLVIKDKTMAKQMVVKNLQKDPTYYSKLHMMGIEPDEKNEALMEVMAHLKARKYAQKNGDFYR